MSFFNKMAIETLYNVNGLINAIVVVWELNTGGKGDQ